MSNVPEVQAKITPFLAILDGVRTLISNPVLGFGGTGRVVSLMMFAGELLRDAAAGAGELDALNLQIQMLVQYKRGPTDEEWAIWRDRLVAVDARFARIRESL